MEKTVTINNELYDELGERWYLANDDPVALLRQECQTKVPWIRDCIARRLAQDPSKTKVLDVGCGAGFLTNDLAKMGYLVTGLDQSPSSLAVARKYDETRSVNYVDGDALHLPFPDSTFSVVTAMDFLEHVERPELVVKEAARVLQPGGLFLFHTFNRNLLSYFLVIKGVEWFIRNTPKHMHLYRMFIKPAELRSFCEAAGMPWTDSTGLKPKFSNLAFWRTIFTGYVHKEFKFVLCSSLLISYMGCAKKS